MYRRVASKALDIIDESTTSSAYRKPAWVRATLIRLAATHPGWGCRPLTDLFNHQCSRHQLTVGKSFVAELLRKHQPQIREQRRQWRLRAPYVYPLHAVWGLDLTTLATQSCLGVIDHGSRQLMGLAALPNKRTITVLRTLLDIFERYGVPRSIRTDNEAMFTSFLFRMFLHCLGTRHQRIPPGCPWKNGRIERLFGTLKQTLAAWHLPNTMPLQTVLNHFSNYYNTYRPHQALNGRTPLQAAQRRANTTAIKPNQRRRWH
ncbi:MAG: transposase [Gammaproteobacteria bacterium]